MSIALAADSTPTVVSATGLTVDEDGFVATRNLDEVPAASNETDSTESLTDTTGIAKVTFGNDVPLPANLLTSIQLVDTGAALDTQLTTLAGNPVVFAVEVGTGDLVGKDGATEVIRIHITGASVTNVATGEVTYTYSTTLSQPVKHAALDGGADDNSENTAVLTGVTFEVTDKDTDTTQGTFNVTIVDDVPTAAADMDYVSAVPIQVPPSTTSHLSMEPNKPCRPGMADLTGGKRLFITRESRSLSRAMRRILVRIWPLSLRLTASKCLGQIIRASLAHR